MLIFASAYFRICLSSRLLIFTSSYLHIFSYRYTCSSYLHICLFLHLPITSADLHICLSLYLLIFPSTYLHIYSSSHLLIFASAHLRICLSSHQLIFISAHLPSFPSFYLHNCWSSHLLTFSLIPSFYLSLLRPRVVSAANYETSTLSHEMRVDRQKLRKNCDLTCPGATLPHEMRVDRPKLR